MMKKTMHPFPIHFEVLPWEMLSMSKTGFKFAVSECFTNSHTLEDSITSVSGHINTKRT